ncbi:hypothetical protein OCF68_24590 [Bacillus cereus]|nr:hypothetical protein [Bacillus cereus]
MAVTSCNYMYWEQAIKDFYRKQEVEQEVSNEKRNRDAGAK